MKAYLKSIYILLFSISIVSLYYLSNNESGKQIDKLYTHILSISHEYQSLDYLILQHRTGKSYQLDDLNRSLGKITQKLNEALALIGVDEDKGIRKKSRDDTARSTSISSKIYPALVNLNNDFVALERKIEEFKSSTSMLNNSLRHLISQRDQDIDNSEKSRILNEFLFYVLAIKTFGNSSHLEKINNLNNSIQENNDNQLKNLSNHLDVTTKSIASLVSIYNDIQNKGFSSGISDLKKIVSDARQQHLEKQSKYNIALFLVIIFMFIFIALALIKMHIVNQQLTASKNQAVLANKSKSLFLANMSHELRTPMHSILSYSEFGIRRAEKLSPEKTSQYFTNINSSGKRLLDLLNTLLDLSKIETGKMSYDICSNNLNETIESVISEFELIFREKNLTVEYQNSQNITFDFDHEKITQVIRNIINNAINFSWPDEKISIITDSSTNNVTVSIYNVGDAIQKDELQNIFESFQQSKGSQSGAGGTGLGLAICKGIVNSHHGKIWANCIEDNITVFTFSLPKKQPDPIAEKDECLQGQAA